MNHDNERTGPTPPKGVTSPQLQAIYHTLSLAYRFATTQELEHELHHVPQQITEIATELQIPEDHPMAREAADDIQQLIRHELERRLPHHPRRTQP